MTYRRYIYLYAAALFLGIAAYFAPTLATGNAPPSNPPTVKVLQGKGHGSGVHIGNGYIVTAAHVTKDSEEVQLKTIDGKMRKAQVLWTNKAYDIALLRTSATDLQSASLDCRIVNVGTPIVGQGNPMQTEFIAAYGKIAGEPRKLGPWASVYITDITTVPGQSGGPAMDEAGRVIGITVGVMGAPIGLGASLVGYGFVVPSSDVCALMGRA